MMATATNTPAHPWRRVARTVFAWVSGIAPMLPLIIDASSLSEATPGVGGALAISSAVTRVLALPQVETFLQRHVPWLAADDVAAEHVVAQVVEKGGEQVVVAGEAHAAETGVELLTPMPLAPAKPKRRRARAA